MVASSVSWTNCSSGPSTEPVPTLKDAGAQAPESLCSIHAALTSRDPGQRPDSAKDVAGLQRRFAQLEPSDAAVLLSERMTTVFPDRLDELSRWLREEGVQRTKPLPERTPSVAPSPAWSRLWTLLTAAALLGVFALGLPAINRFYSATSTDPQEPRKKAMPSTPAAQPAPSASQAPVPLATSAPSAAAATPATGRKTPVASAGASASAPPSRSATPVRADKLDEHPPF